MTSETAGLLLVALLAGPVIAGAATVRELYRDHESFRALKWRVFLIYLAGIWGAIAVMAAVLALGAGPLGLALAMVPIALAFIFKPEPRPLSADGPAGDRRVKVAGIATITVAVLVVLILEPYVGNWAYVPAVAFVSLPLAWVARDPQSGVRGLLRTYPFVLGGLLAITGFILLLARLGLID